MISRNSNSAKNVGSTHVALRVIYFYRDADLPLYLLMIYAKARQEDLSADEKRAVRKLVGILKS